MNIEILGHKDNIEIQGFIEHRDTAIQINMGIQGYIEHRDTIIQKTYRDTGRQKAYRDTEGYKEHIEIQRAY